MLEIVERVQTIRIEDLLRGTIGQRRVPALAKICHSTSGPSLAVPSLFTALLPPLAGVKFMSHDSLLYIYLCKI